MPHTASLDVDGFDFDKNAAVLSPRLPSDPFRDLPMDDLGLSPQNFVTKETDGLLSPKKRDALYYGTTEQSPLRPLNVSFVGATSCSVALCCVVSCRH